jgi:hypothetical protein
MIQFFDWLVICFIHPPDKIPCMLLRDLIPANRTRCEIYSLQCFHLIIVMLKYLQDHSSAFQLHRSKYL